MSIADWDEGTLERFVQDRVFSDPRLVALLGAGSSVPTYTTATLPTGLTKPAVVFVSDGGAGAVFQGWTGSAWVNLG